MMLLDSNFTDLTDKQECFMKYSDHVRVDASVEQVFSVIADVVRYPEFLPWWQAVKVLERQGNTMIVQQDLGFPFLNWTFETKAELDYPCHICIKTIGENSAQFLIDWNMNSIDACSTWLSVVITTACHLGSQHCFLHNMLSHSTKPLLRFFVERIMSLVVVDE